MLTFPVFVATRIFKQILVVPNPKDMPGRSWAVQAPGIDRPTISLHITQASAYASARELMICAPDGGSILVSGIDGKFQEERTINRKDPFPPRG